MKFGIMFANAGRFAYPDRLAQLGRSAEAVGFESVWAIEHVVVPVGYTSVYPYDPRGRLPGSEKVAIADPMLALAYLAAVTDRLKLATGVLILPQRHPAYVAKEAATLDVLSRGRTILGVGIGWLREEFEVVGVPFGERAARTEETIRAVRSLWKAEPEPFAGRFFRWGAVECNPKPVRPGGVPIVVGGHADSAARRAARCADGFFPGRGDEGRLRALIDILRAECRRIGRRPGEVEVTAVLPRPDLDVIRRYQDLGVSRLVMGSRGSDAASIRGALETFGDRVIARL